MRTILALLALLLSLFMRPVARLIALAAMVLLLYPAPALAADGTTAPPSALLDTASWGLIAGILTPLILSVVQQPQWTGRTRVLVHVVASAVVGVLTCLTNGTLDTNVQTVLSTIAVVLVASSAAYRSLFKPSGIAGAIESATSPSKTTT